MIRGRDVRVVMRIGGEEVTLENAGARVESASAFYGIDRSVAPERLGGWSIGFTAHETGDGPLYFTTDHSSSWDSLWSAISAAGAVPAYQATIDGWNREALHEQLNYPRDPHDDQVDALVYAMQHAGIQTIPPRHAMSQMISGLTPLDRVEAVRRIRDNFADDPAMRDTLLRAVNEPPRVNVQRLEVTSEDPDRFIAGMVEAMRSNMRRPTSAFGICRALRRVLNDELTTPDGFPFTAPQ